MNWRESSDPHTLSGILQVLAWHSNFFCCFPIIYEWIHGFHLTVPYYNFSYFRMDDNCNFLQDLQSCLMEGWETLQPTKKAPTEVLNSVEEFPAEQFPLSIDAEVHQTLCTTLKGILQGCSGNCSLVLQRTPLCWQCVTWALWDQGNLSLDCFCQGQDATWTVCKLPCCGHESFEELGGRKNEELRVVLIPSSSA